MSATAVLHKITETHTRPTPSVAPIVLLDGKPTEELRVRSVSMIAPLDTRTAELVVRRDGAATEAQERGRVARLLGRVVMIVQPVALAGGASRLLPLFAGRIEAANQRMTGRKDELSVTAVCDWSRTLERRFEAGDADWTIDGLVVKPIAGQTRGRALASSLEEGGMVIQRAMRWDGHSIGERRTVRPIAAGRPIRLALSEVANPNGAVTKLSAAVRPAGPTKLIALADGQRVESTFTLVKGWDDSLQGLSDDEYTRSTSSDFDAVTNAFRCWVLNEDGAYSGAPFDRGEAFSLTAFFDEGRAVEPRAMVFGGTLTRDENGRSLGIIVEITTDGGTTWSRYGGAVRVLTDRAGVYLDDDALHGSLMSAARSGLAGVRVTATLRCPLAMERVRWAGNPFAGAFAERRWRLGERFTHRRVDGASRFYASVHDGTRTADERDDRAAMEAWLVKQADMLRVTSGETGGDTTAEIETIEAMPALRIGDRLEMLAGRAIGADLSDPRSSGPSAWLEWIEHRWDGSTSRLRWRMKGGGA